MNYWKLIIIEFYKICFLLKKYVKEIVMKINVSPSKEFFLEMLTRDITLNDSILDLIDNSLDGARRLKENLDYSGLKVKIEISENEFSITDNCGGIDKRIAETYAFKFGRPDSADNGIKYSIGRFGIGMKRALFKIGKAFEIRSRTESDNFSLSVNVDQWKKMNEWEFSLEENKVNEGIGTSIIVKDIHTNIKTSITNLDQFINRLSKDISIIYYAAIQKGLEILINGISVTNEDISILDNEIFSSSSYKNIVDGIELKIIAGLSNPNPHEAGWYVYCNDRLVLQADKTEVTGWGDKIGEVEQVLYHNDYAMFRGVVFLEAEDPVKLPLTTTKKGVDIDSQIYHYVKNKMVEIFSQMKPYFKNIKDIEDKDALIADIKNSPKQNLRSILERVKDNEQIAFNIKKDLKEISSKSTVKYLVEKDLLEEVKKNLGVKSNKDVGQKTFEYYINMECD